MRTILPAAVLLLLPTAGAASVPSNRAIALEFGVDTPAAAAGPAASLVSLTASAWLDGPVEAFATVARADGGVRGTSARGTAGLRAVAGRVLQASIGADVGLEYGADGSAGPTWGAGAGVGRRLGPIVMGLRSWLRSGPGGLRLELAAGIGAAF